MIILDDYKNKISFRDDFQKNVFKCVNVCVTNVTIIVSEDITFYGENWVPFMVLPFIPKDITELWFSPLICMERAEILFPIVGDAGKVHFYTGQTIKSGSYYFHWVYHA